MTDEVATTTGLSEWTPDVGALPEGWRIVQVVLNADVDTWRHQRREAEITLRYDPFHPDSYHEVRLRVVPATPPVAEWLHPFLEAMSKVPWPSFAEVEFPRPRCAGEP